MPVEYVVLNQGTLVLEWWTGTISHEEVLAHERRHLSDSSIARGASVLANAMSASFETTPEQVHEVVDLYRRFAETLRVGKVAILVDETAYGRAQLYAKQVADLGLRVILLSSLDVACKWVGADVLMVYKELDKLRAGLASQKLISSQYP
jgi:hypothetical protein